MTKLNASTYQFLEQLGKNNDRDWFTANKPKFELAKEDAEKFAERLLIEMRTHDHIEGAKVFRIYRDVRFSKDKTPYKTNFGIGFTRATAKLRGGCYVNLEPGNTFVGGGFWQPNSEDLKRIRNEFVSDASEIRNIISSKKFKSFFGDLSGEELKTAPRGYDKDHPNVDLLKKKQYLMTKTFSDKEALSATFLQDCNDTFKAMRPIFDYLSEVLTTNENGESIL